MKTFDTDRACPKLQLLGAAGEVGPARAARVGHEGPRQGAPKDALAGPPQRPPARQVSAIVAATVLAPHGPAWGMLPTGSCCFASASQWGFVAPLAMSAGPRPVPPPQ